MPYDPVPEIYFTERLTASAPREFVEAVRDASGRAGLTMADFVRVALAERMGRDGVAFPHLPILSPRAGMVRR